MRLVEIDVHLEETDQVFSYWHEGKTLLHFNASLLARIRLQIPSEFVLLELGITDAMYNLCMEHRGIEEPKVAALKGKHLREPGLGVVFDGWYSDDIPSYTLIDGHHRAVRRYRGGLRTMDMWVCQRHIWKNCLMKATPEEDAMVAAAIPPKVESDVNIIQQVRPKNVARQ